MTTEDGATAKATQKPREIAAVTPGANGQVPETVDYRDKVDILAYERAAGTGQRHPLKGFMPDYTDIVDYIVRCTHKMWEEGAIGLLYEHYAHDTKVWSEWGCSYGREETMGYVAQRLAGFPDFRIYPDDVIWTGNDVEGFCRGPHVKARGRARHDHEVRRHHRGPRLDT